MKSIYLLRYFFSFGYLMVIIMYVAMGIGLLANIFLGMGTFDELLFSGIGISSTEVSYALVNNVAETVTASVDVKIGHLSSENIYMKIFGFINLSVMSFFSIFTLKLLSGLFYNLSEVNSWGGYFTKENYSIIRKIAFLTLGTTLYAFLINAIFSWILIKDLTVFGESFQLHPDVSGLTSLVTVLVLFGAAKIFKAAIKMKEEAELTI